MLVTFWTFNHRADDNDLNFLDAFQEKAEKLIATAQAMLVGKQTTAYTAEYLDVLGHRFHRPAGIYDYRIRVVQNLSSEAECLSSLGRTHEFWNAKHVSYVSHSPFLRLQASV